MTPKRDPRRAPTPDELHCYAVAWGESEVVHLTNWRYWEKLYDQALEVIRRQAIEIEEKEGEIKRLKDCKK